MGLYGSVDALEDLSCDQLNRSGELRISLGRPGGDGLNPQLPGSVGLALYRVIAELINNTLKHAKAANVLILVEVEGGLVRIAYNDDGIGMKMVRPGMEWVVPPPMEWVVRPSREWG